MPRTCVPADLVAARGQFEAWRRRRAGRVIPPDLWGCATELARRHGVHRTAMVLRLDYYSLRRRVEEGVRGPTPAFVDIGPAAAPNECVMEIEDARGPKLRMQLRGFSARDLAMVARSMVLRR